MGGCWDGGHWWLYNHVVVSSSIVVIHKVSGLVSDSHDVADASLVVIAVVVINVVVQGSKCLEPASQVCVPLFLELPQEHFFLVRLRAKAAGRQQAWTWASRP